MEYEKLDDKSENLLKCEHYNRGCHLLYPCCDKFYACRFCHNEDQLHEADRKLVTKMKCRWCLEIQDINNICINCKRQIGNYFCKICKLLDLDDKQQYHCDKCG